MKPEDSSKIVEIEQRLDAIQAEKAKLLEEAASIDGFFLSSYEIRPAGRHLLTIGEDLIQDRYAAIVELVKNCYDADSPDAIITFRSIQEDDRLEIEIKDNGHGMSTIDIITKWLVPSTSYKLSERKSPHGRTMQGRKGIGRYAASILGDDFHMQTVDLNGQETTLHIQWTKLVETDFLDQIKVPIHTAQTNKRSGTVLTMCSRLSENEYWTTATIQKLRFELKKLIPPKPDNLLGFDFKIHLQFDGFFSGEEYNTKEVITPYPILDLYDYRISGRVSEDGSYELTYENQKVRNGIAEKMVFSSSETGCGSLVIDIRVYDRDKDAIDHLIMRGLRDENGVYVSKLEARQLLNDVNGIGVYRNGFRIRPLGDADFDWLKLNEQRVQNPSMKIGSNQVVGYVHVESEEVSGLEEKSARDGLKSNSSYDALKDITCKVISILEERRFIFRRNVGLSNPAKKLEKQLDGLYDYTSLKKSIAVPLVRAGMSQVVISEILEMISKEENTKNKTIEDIKHAVAVYQGQATLGKIINIILHEGRRPLNYFKNQTPNLLFYGKRFSQKRDDDSYNEIARLANGIVDNARLFVDLFGKLDPLSAKRRETKKEFPILDALKGAVTVFEKECEDKDIAITINCPSNIRFVGWKQDFYTIMVNLLDNSIFWIAETNSSIREICINVANRDSEFIIDYVDSGPGISNDLLQSGVIFEPEFTTKPYGTGLGLSIAGEAATRNGMKLTAIESDKGAHFIITIDE